MRENIPHFGIIGINHKTAAVEIREKVSMDAEEQKYISSALFKRWNIEGCLLLSTCNRSEIYIYKYNLRSVVNEIKSWLDGYKKTTYFINNKITYSYFGWEAVEHFIRVISSLDSQIIGEPQITNQVKEAYKNAYDQGFTNTFINKLFDFSLNIEKRIRSDTFLNDGAVSVSFAAVELAKKIYSKLDNKNILLIGSGETAELAAKHFIQKGASSLYIANRTFKHAKNLAQKINGTAILFEEIEKNLFSIDIVLSATNSSKYIISGEMMKRVSSKTNFKPIFLIDLAIPRDIDPEIRRLNGVFLYNMDDLEEIALKNLQSRYAEIPKANKIIEENLAIFKSWYNQRCTALIITELKQYFESVRKKEFNQLKKRFRSENWDDIEYLTKRIVNKLLHRHIKSLKESADNPELFQQYLDLLNVLYRLDSHKIDIKRNENS
jgi:glutamyl-tRNA reductase